MFQYFEHVLRTVYGSNNAGWPDNFVDSYCWTRLQLLKHGLLANADEAVTSEEDQREAILIPLRRIAAREYVSDIDISDFRLHAQEAEAYFGSGT